MLLWFDKIKEQFLQEYDRWFLWVPVLFGVGILLYFALPVEPSIWLTLGVVEALILAAILLRHNIHALGILAVFGVMILGFANVQLKAVYLAKRPILTENIDKVYFNSGLTETQLESILRDGLNSGAITESDVDKILSTFGL